MEIRLDGKVALITGASKGIGRAIGAEFAAAGASVMLSSRKADALALAAESMPGEVAWHAANAGDREQIEACVAATIDRFGRIDILVNNAATNPYRGPMMGLEVSAAEKTFRVNVLGPLLWAQAAWRAWMEENGGSVVNIASTGGLQGRASQVGWYNMTKAALIHLSQSLAGELAPGVRVNSILPGLVKTDMSRAAWDGREDTLAESFPVGRLGVPDDIATVATFLASDAAAWITGSTFTVDGGSAVR